jgi:hypothetical protein
VKYWCCTFPFGSFSAAVTRHYYYYYDYYYDYYCYYYDYYNYNNYYFYFYYYSQSYLYRHAAPTLSPTAGTYSQSYRWQLLSVLPPS